MLFEPSVLIIEPYPVYQRILLHRFSHCKNHNDLNHHKQRNHDQRGLQRIVIVSDIEHPMILCPQEYRISCDASVLKSEK